MVQIIQERREPSGLERFLQMIGSGLSGVAEGGGALKQAMNAKNERETLSEQFGSEFKDIQNPDLQKLILAEKMRGQSQLQQQNLGMQADQQNYEKYKDVFGEKAANTWLSLGQGERTEFTKALLDAKFSGLDLEKYLQGVQAPKDQQNVVKQLETESPSQIIKRDEVPDYRLNTQGMNRKEVVNFQSDLRKFNQPIWKESADRLASYKELDRDIGTLNNLNKRGNLPKKFGKLIINPASGAPYEIASAVKDMHPDVQQWVKTIARQATQAQSAFPGRVTNFDLMSYMRQFPNLFNTEQGRDVILQQMKLTNEAHQLYEDALNKVYKKYKLSGITPEDADDLAHQMVDDKIAQIDEKLSSLAFEGEKLASGEKESKQEQGRRVEVVDAQGNVVGDVDESEVDQLPEGYRIK